jgi:hypothetical protein
MAFAFPQAWGGTFYSGTSFTAAFGQATVAGNTLITFITKDDDQIPSTPAPPGWIQLYSSQVQGQIWMGAYYKIADGTETAFSSIGDNEIWAVYGFEISGGDSTDPITTVGSLITNTTSSATVRIPAMVSGSFMFGHVGVDRNRTFGTWQVIDGTEPTDQNVLEGVGAGDVSQLIVGAIYGSVTSDFFKGRNLSASDEWGTHSIVINEPISTPVISSPTGTPVTTSSSAAEIQTPGFTTDISQGTGYWYLSSSGTPPSATDLIAGTGAIQSGSDAITATTVTFATITGLSPSTGYFLHYIHQNIVKNSNILSINVSTPAFQIPITFVDQPNTYYTGAQTRWKTTYQNTGTAYATLTDSLTPPPVNDVISNTNSSWIIRTADFSWTPTATPSNLSFNQITGPGGGSTIFENTEYYVHAFIDDPGAGQSDVETHTFTTRHRFTVSNFVLVEANITSLLIDYDQVLNESTAPRVKIVLNQSPTPLNGQQVNQDPNDWNNGFPFVTAADGTYQINPTGLEALTTYYVHVTWFDNSNNDYTTQANWPVISPALTVSTALNSAAAAITANKGCIIRSTLAYSPISFGSPARNVTTITEQLVTNTNIVGIDLGRNANGAVEELITAANPASISFGGNRLVTTNTEQLLLTEANAVVGKGQTVLGTTEAIVISESSAILDRARNANTLTEVLTLTENAASVVVQIDRAITTNLEILVLAESTGVVIKNIRPRLVLTANAATIRRDSEFTTTLESLLLAVNSGAVQQARDVLAPTESLVVSTSAAVIIRDRLAATLTEALTLQTNTATVRKDPNVFGITEQLLVSANAAIVQKDATANADTQTLILGTSAADVRRGRTPRADTEQIVLAPNQADIDRDRLALAATEALILSLTASVVGQGQTVRGATELLVAQGTPAPLRRDRLVVTLPEAGIKTLIVAKATIGRGVTVRTGSEQLILQTTQASFARGSNIQAQTEELVCTLLPVIVGRGKLIVGATENLVLQTNAGFVAQSTDRRVACATEALTLLPQSGTIVQDAVLALLTEQLILGATRAIVQQIRRAEGPGLPFYGKEGVEIVLPTVKAQAKNNPRSGVLVLNPPDNP